MRFEERDGWLLVAIQEIGDGKLTRRHIKRLFWAEAIDNRALERRLKKLQEAGYIAWPSREQYKVKPIPEPIIWLDWRGALWLAGQRGITVDAPENSGQNQLRKLERALRDHNFRWLRNPGFSNLAHDIAVVDFRLAMEQAVSRLPTVLLEKWVLESELRAYGDEVEYRLRDPDGTIERKRQGVAADAFIILADETRRNRGEPFRSRFLLEIDMGTHPVKSGFAYNKAVPYAAYITSPVYQQRFDCNSGRYLVVTTGERRLEHLLQQTQQAVKDRAYLFLFSTLEQVQTKDPLISPIWWQTTDGKLVSLLTID